MIESVTKRDGRVESFTPSKLNGWGEWAAKALGPAQRSRLAGAAARLVEALPANQAGPAENDPWGGRITAPAIDPASPSR